MAVVPILEYPHPALRSRAKPVVTIDGSTQRLADDLMDTLVHSEGVGLAANQIGSLLRVIALRMPDEEEPTVYVNPRIVHREGTRRVEEGCLSFSNHYGVVERSIWVKVTGLDRKSGVIRLYADDLLGQAFEHEIDHLNGILFIDHLLSHHHLFEYASEAGDSRTNADDPDAAAASR